MPAFTHSKQFMLKLEREPGQKLTFARLAELLGPPWTEEKVREKARRFEKDEGNPLWIVKGGIQHLGSEKFTSPGLYLAIQDGIEKRWATAERIPRAKVEQVYLCGDRGSGTWTRPDLVIVSQRKAHVEYHSIEAEQPDGFGIRSIYQAYEQGFGAHYSWVFFGGPQPTGREWDRTMRAAKQLGVGLVHLPKASQPSRWKTVRKARLRPVATASRTAFLKSCGLGKTGDVELSVPNVLAGVGS
jgi:hypothetical protein